MKAVEKLQRALDNRNVIPVIGAGVSMGAAGLPSWGVLLQKGIEYVEKYKKQLNVTPAKIKALKAISSADTLIEGFALLQNLLGGAPDSVHYRAFLHEQFAGPTVKDPATLTALRNIAARTVVTTNYDLLLSDYGVVPDGEIATWDNPQQILSLLRGGRGIIHLHGRYNLPKSVILSSSDYTRLVHSDEDSSTIARALFYSGVLLFVGASLESVGDPHLSAILNEFSRLHGPLLEKATPHFMLVRGKLEGTAEVRLHQLGIESISYGDSFSDLPKFLGSISHREQIFVQPQDIRARLHNLRVAQTRAELLLDVKTFINEVIYPGRKIRIAFAEKTKLDGRTVLRTNYLFPPKSTHNIFSYPQTLAAWALIEGQIFAYSPDIDYLGRPCNFNFLRKIKKFNRVRDMLLATNAEIDPLLSEFLNPADIIHKVGAETLMLSDLYQHWVGDQPEPHYKQFISIPVPVIDEIVGQKEPPEYGVINIDTLESEALLTEEVTPLLKLASDLIALGFEILQEDSKEERNDETV